jgi:hypothetical protein
MERRERERERRKKNVEGATSGELIKGADAKPRSMNVDGA